MWSRRASPRRALLSPIGQPAHARAVGVGMSDHERRDDEPINPVRGYFRRLLFLNFNLVNRADRWLQRRFTPAGRMLLGAVLLAAVFGINTRIAVAHQLAVLALCLIVVATLWAPLFRPRIDVRRRLPRYAQVGAMCTYTVVLRNRGRRPIPDADWLEELRPAPSIWNRPGLPLEPEDQKRNWFDRNVGYPRWARLMRLARGATLPMHPVPRVPAGGRVEFRVHLSPLRRGYLTLAKARLLGADPMGIFYGQRLVEQTARMLVLPRTHTMDWPACRGRKADESRGMASSRRQGGVDEFASIREFQPGDPLRHIHWRGWARYGTPVVKEFHDQRLPRRTVVLSPELWPGVNRQNFEAAVEIAASLVGAGRHPGDPCALVIGGADPQWLGADGPEDQTTRQLEALALVRPTAPAPTELLVQFLQEHAQRVDECVLVYPTWDDRIADQYQAVASTGVPANSVFVQDSARLASLDDRSRGLPEGVTPIPVDSVGPALVELGRAP